jgi:DNA-binding transcriptional MerR regulator
MGKIFQTEIDLLNAKRIKEGYFDTIALMGKIQERKFSVKDIRVNYRWLDHWHSRGLLFSNYDRSKWKKFNLQEYVWIKIILKLRAFNIGLETIAAVKMVLDSEITGEDLLENSEINFNEIITQFAPSNQKMEAVGILSDPEIQNKIKETRINVLGLFIIDILLLGNYYSIIINPAGEIFPVKYSYLEIISNIPGFQNIISGSFVSISVTEILRDFILEQETIQPRTRRLALLSDEETLVLNTIRQDDLRSVIIRFDNRKKMNLLEEIRETKIDKSTRVAELIIAKGYQDITIKTQNGDIVFCENKKKMMIQNKE